MTLVSHIKRQIEGLLSQSAKDFRVLTLLGPRQAGKTTLVRSLFPNYAYGNLEDPEQRRLAESDPKTYLQRYPAPAIFDEIQRVPELLSYIQIDVDENPNRRGAYILTGSHQPLLKETISQTLAGRTTVHTLLPLSMREILEHDSSQAELDSGTWMHRGFLPEVVRANLNPYQAYRSYYETYVERDVRQIIQVKDQSLFEKFIRLIAGRIGQLVNMDSLASDVGVSPKTISEWISVLEASFIIYRLPPYFENLGKRLVKRPKIYFVDVGLAGFLLGLSRADQVTRDPLFGNLFENLVVSELLKDRLNRGFPRDLYFYRDSHGREIDVLYQSGRSITPIEIKASATYNDSLIKSLSYFSDKVRPKGPKGHLIYSGTPGPVSKGVTAHSFTQAWKTLPI